jgi:hypothetical protein
MLGRHIMSFGARNACVARRMAEGAFLGVAVVASFILLTSVAARAQATTSLRGTVTDQSGSTVAGANVVLSNSESKTERSAITGEQGVYQFLFLPPGTYKFTITAAGFQRYELTSLQLLVNTPATINAQLKVGAATETVNVSSEQPALNLVDASIGNSFGETQVKQVPLEGRNVPDLLSLQAGVAYTGNRNDIDKDQDTRNGSVNGARSDQSNITLDGVDVNDQANGYAFTSVLPVTLDSVQEFRVTTTNYGADQGQGSGAQIALVTKSGTNQFHGSAYEYIRNTFTSANDYLVKAAEIRDGQANKPLKLNRNIFGVSLGGPLRKDRLFFFTNYEGTREREEQSAVRSIPTPSMCQGNLSYQNVNGGITTLAPTDIRNLDPVHQGINPVMLDLTNHTGYLDKTFCTGQFTTNDTSVGDGLNYSGFRFRAPVNLNNNAFIGRLDYHVDGSGKHTLFWRGALQNLSNPQAPLLPGGAPVQTIADHSKGFALGYTALLSSAMVNSFHWGFTRQSYGAVGNANQEWNTFIGLDQGIAYSRNSQLPVNNFADDFSWTKGTHTLQFGTNIGVARNARTSYLHSFNFGLGTSSWMSPTALADSASPLDPTNGGFPEVNLADKAGYDRPMISLLGIVSDVVAQYNYNKTGQVENYVVDANGNPISPTGLPMKRHYGLNWYEFYGQDSWRVTPNLTVTYGLRWSLFPSPWETNGMQAASAFSLGKQFNINESNMKQGLGYTSESLISLIPGGPVNNGAGFYHLSKSDFAPRISVAYSPKPNSGWLQTLFGDAGKTSIRAGFGEVYDRAGFQLLNTFDQNAPGGFAYTLQNTCCQPGIDDAADVPRITNINVVPTVNQNNVPFMTPAPPGAFPQTLALNAQANLWVVDDTLKTPHSYSFDFSIGRELPHRFALQVSYVGRFGGHLLTQRDLNQPLDIVDPKSGIDYFAAASALSKLARQGYTTSQITDSLVGPTAAYWHNMLPALPAGATSYTSFGTPVAAGNAGLIQAVYDLYYNPALSYVGNEIVGLADIDLYGGLGADNGQTLFFNGPAGPNGNGSGKYLNSQAISAYGWSSVGNSNYHALQATLSKQLSRGLQFDLNYTYSKSIDVTSTASRVGFALVGYQNIGLLGSRLENAFRLNALRAVSDFDTTHQINANWIVEMPFGRGRRFLPSASSLTEAVIGGWQLSGLARWTTGFPVSIDVGQNWPTDWQYTGLAQMTAPTKAGVFRQPNGSVTLFSDPASAQANFSIPLPGGSGSRNVLRADGYAGLDMALSKRWKTFESQSLQFRWEVFNVLNQVRFNAQGVGSALPSLLQAPSAFGTYSGLLTQPRVMQFALRYEF